MKDPQDNQNSVSNHSVNHSANCERVEDRIHELMDHRQSLLSDRLVRDHVSHCDRCAELVVDFGALNDSLSQIPIETLHRLSGIQDAEPHYEKSAPVRLHPLTFIASLACIMLVMLTSGIWFVGQPAATVSIVEVDHLDHLDPEVEPDVETFEVSTLEPTDVVDDVPEVAIPQSDRQGLAFLTRVHKTPVPTDLLNASNLLNLGGNVEPYQDYIDMTAGLPGIRPVSKSVNATLHLIKTFSSQPQQKKRPESRSDAPDLGFTGDACIELCSV